MDIAIQELAAIKEVLYGRQSLDVLTKLFHTNQIMQDSELNPISPRTPTKETKLEQQSAQNSPILLKPRPQNSPKTRSNISSSTDGTDGGV
jgi:hypothetical protein